MNINFYTFFSSTQQQTATFLTENERCRVYVFERCMQNTEANDWLSFRRIPGYDSEYKDLPTMDVSYESPLLGMSLDDYDAEKIEVAYT